MTLFYGFLLGIGFTIFVYPLITDIYSIIAQGVEYINTKIACGTARMQIEIQKEQVEEEGESNAFAVGFQYNEPEEYWEDDDDDEFWEEDE